MAKIELLFGTERPTGEAITDAEWATFLEEEVTPRFQEGFTVLRAHGQWQRPDGKIVQSDTRMLLLWYTPEAGLDAARSAAIDHVRNAYRARFQQLSVMRVQANPAAALDCVQF